MTKTYEVWLGADGATPPYDRPLMPVCTPQWYADSMVFGELTVANPDRDVVNQYDVKVNEAFDAYMKAREDNREYGQFNFGDWWGERVINWGNIEYDTQHAFFLQFARSGDLRFLQAGEEAERHNRDVDTVHAHQDPQRVGRVYAHCIGHVGNYYQKSPLDGPNRGSPRGGFTPSHTWCEGHTDHFFLTGERRSQTTAAKIADHYGTYGTRDYDFRNCREPGWDLIFTMAVYRGTSDPFYLNAARIIVDRVLERQTPEPALGTAGGGWRRRMVPGHCLCEPAHYGNAGFMVGVLLTGLKWYHLETGDARVAESLHQGARFLANDMWEPDIQGFRYTTCPKSSKGAWSNLLLFDGMGYAYRLTGDKDIARVLMAGTDAAIESLSGWGKSYTMYIRVAPHVLGLLADLRETPPMPLPRLLADVPTAFSGRQAVRFDASTSVVPKGLPVTYAWAFGDGTTGTGATVEKTYAPGQYRAVLTVGAGDATETAETTVVMPPLSTLAKLDDRAVVVEAETFAAQGGGQVKTASGRRGASGSIVTGWEDAIGHWLEWKASVPRAGRYHLLLKYCSGATNPRRELRLNGQVPGEAAREIRFEPTGGYSTGTDNWAYLTVGGNDAPMVLDLPAGESTLRLTNLGDGLALDWILLRPVD
ncbi:MAG: PKD domain-containing protein [Lentisphaerae bacterium]|nr:PKD domain-containing protein [Lentisphaerota bacterium]